MIRMIAIVSLGGLLVLVLYLPSTYPSARFHAQIRADHLAVARFWGEDAGLAVLEATLERQRGVRDVAPIPSTYDAPRVERVDGAVAEEMSSVNRRLFANPYFGAVDAMLLLALYRARLSIEWSLWLLPLPAAVAVDSLVRRRVKALEIVQHDPEVFATLAAAAILVACGTVLLLVLPVPLHPALLPAAPIIVLTLSARALANFHTRP